MLDGETVEREATHEQLVRVHEPAYLELLQAVDRPVQLDADTVCSKTSWQAATLAAGVALEAVDRSGFALVRPPGHHALAGRAMGFCLLNNVAVAARYAQTELGLERIAIVDFDVHHGNGTEALFRGDDTILFVSLHQWPFWPGSGGPGTSDESTLNLPLPAGSGDDDYRAAFESAVEPAVRAFGPDLVLVSAGFDAHADDPLAQMEDDGGGVPGPRRTLRCTRPARRRSARGRLQPRDAARARRRRPPRLHRLLRNANGRLSPTVLPFAAAAFWKETRPRSIDD